MTEPAAVDSLIEVEAALRAEADAMLFDRGLHQLLSEYGDVHPQGSYNLQLMVWRDLDIYLAQPQADVPRFFDLGTRLAALLSPVRMSFRNEHLARTPDLPQGLYWGIYLGNEREGVWKVDVWQVDSEAYMRHEAFESALKAKLTSDKRGTILAIKSACWQDPGYRREFSSVDIYQAVLDRGVANLTEFQEYLRAKAGGDGRSL